MIRTVVAGRYAEALFSLAKEQGQLDQTAADLEVVARFFEQQPQLRLLLSQQRITAAAKKGIVRDLWQKLVSPTVLAFIELLVDKHRERILEETIQGYQDLLREERNIAVAEVKTAFPLDREAEDRLKQALERKLGKQIELSVKVRPALIGGLVVQVGDRVFDGSLTKQLQLLRARLVDRSLGKLEVEG